MKKCKRYGIYLNAKDLNLLQSIAKKAQKTQSAVIRNFIRISKYADTLKQIQISNEINTQFLTELKKIGINLNQIAYHLNIDITTENSSKDKFEEMFVAFKNIIEEYQSKTKAKIIKLPKSQSVKGLDDE